jgi:hypothetical protein
MKNFGEILKLNKIYETFVPVKADLNEKFIGRAWITPEGEFIDLGTIGNNGISHDAAMIRYPKIFGIKKSKNIEDYRYLQDLGFIRVSEFDDNISFNPLKLTDKSISAALKWIDGYYDHRDQDNDDFQVCLDISDTISKFKTVESKLEAKKIILRSKDPTMG